MTGLSTLEKARIKLGMSLGLGAQQELCTGEQRWGNQGVQKSTEDQHRDHGQPRFHPGGVLEDCSTPLPTPSASLPCCERGRLQNQEVVAAASR